MRVLWFTNVPVGAMVSGDLLGSGGWMDALLRMLRQIPNLDLAVCCVSIEVLNDTFEKDGVTYYTRLMPRRKKRRMIAYFDDDERNRDQIFKLCTDVIQHFKPTLIHIHGTERAYGLLSTLALDCPILFSIQGLLNVYATWVNTFGNASSRDILRFHGFQHTLRGFGPLWDFFRTVRQGEREKRIIANSHFFYGRTRWDRAHVLALNPQARYFHVGELLRPVFFEHPWELAQMTRHSLFFANGRGPRRNVECLLRAAALLLPKYPDLRLRLGGTTGREDRYSLYITSLTKQLGLRDQVDFLGLLSAERVAEELRSAHAFVLPSRIENSANSLCEAQLLGVPSIAGYVGGTPSLVIDGETGVLVPTDDEALFADAIQRVFEDDALAIRLGAQSRLVALERHDPQRVLDQVLHAYTSTISEAGAGHAS